jgi:hypothetical protein
MTTTSTASSIATSAATSPDTRPTRRTVTRAVAWTVPVVAASAAAPAYAASCSALTGVAFATWSGRITNGGLDYVQTYTPPAGAVASSIEMKIAASYTGFMKAGSEAANGPSLYDVYNPVGNTGKPGLGLIQSVTRRTDRPAPERNARGAYAFSFTKPVRNLVLTFTDIDRTAGDFLDRVELSGPWTEVSRGSGVSGSGTQASPWTGGAAYSDSASGAGNVTVKFAGPLTGFTLTYWNAETSWSGVDRNQAVFVTNVSFDYEPC